jgi:hypothetical protein
VLRKCLKEFYLSRRRLNKKYLPIPKEKERIAFFRHYRLALWWSTSSLLSKASSERKDQFKMKFQGFLRSFFEHASYLGQHIAF